MNDRARVAATRMQPFFTRFTSFSRVGSLVRPTGDPAHAAEPKRALGMTAPDWASRLRSARRFHLGQSAARDLGIVVLLIVVAEILRVWRLTAVGFRGDEAVYGGQAALLAHADGMQRWFIEASRGNSNFLVYQWIVSDVYRVFGVSDYSARFVSVLFSVGTVVLVYLLGVQLYDRLTAALAGFFIAVSGYAVALGRLALLDATACFFITLTVFCAAKWHRSQRFGWFLGIAVAAALAMQTKVISVLVVLVVVVFLAITTDWRRLTARQLAVAAVVGLVSLLPAGIQIVHNTADVRSFLATSITRASGVHWYYYFTTLWSAEGAILAVLFAAGVLRPIFRRTWGDALPLLWLGVFAAFLEFYPLKAFNYLLPVIPPLALLAGRLVALLVGLLTTLRRPTWRASLVTAGAAVVVALAVLGTQFTAVRAAVADDSSVGMREAAYWMRANGLQRAGALALSHGSGQYVLPFYGGIDAYPFGRFRIATVIPGGTVTQSSPRSDGKVPVTWVSDLPAKLIEQGKISYLVYNTRPLDDPPEQSQVADTITEKQFRSLIQTFGGQLVHTVYWHHEARVYIYRVTKRLPKPIVSVRQSGDRVLVSASGFAMGAPLTVNYHGRVIGKATADKVGSAAINLPIPQPGQSEYHLIVSDDNGNSASVTGLPSARLTYTLDAGVIRVFGSHYQPASILTITYGNKFIGYALAKADGTFQYSFKLPVTSHPRFRVKAVDSSGRTASAIGIPVPTVAFAVKGSTVDVTGTHYIPNSVLKLTYAGKLVATTRTDATGNFQTTFPEPASPQPAYQLIATDSIGRHAVATGLGPR